MLMIPRRVRGRDCDIAFIPCKVRGRICDILRTPRKVRGLRRGVTLAVGVLMIGVKPREQNMNLGK